MLTEEAAVGVAVKAPMTVSQPLKLCLLLSKVELWMRMSPLKASKLSILPWCLMPLESETRGTALIEL